MVVGVAFITLGASILYAAEGTECNHGSIQYTDDKGTADVFNVPMCTYSDDARASCVWPKTNKITETYVYTNGRPTETKTVDDCGTLYTS